jgi:hypothetical protein
VVLPDEQAQAAATAASAAAAVASCAAASNSAGSPYVTKCLALKEAAAKCWTVLKRELKPKARRRLVLVDLDSPPSSAAESSADCLSPDTSRQLEAAAALAAAAAAAAAEVAAVQSGLESEGGGGRGSSGGAATSGAEVGHASALMMVATPEKVGSCFSQSFHFNCVT